MSKQVQQVAPEVHTMRVADSTGDSPITWTIDNKEQVARAQAQFEELVNSGRQAFAFPDGDPQNGEVAKTFDPNVKRYTIMPRAAGG